ncbi:MAG: Asp-tRNA(Asn)/Glu-tRNA(Gln) amidotransferase subunit GatC [Bacteroidia bacterium]
MTHIDNATIEKLAQLARLEFSDSEKEELKNDLSKILSYMDKLNEINTDGVEPLIHISDEVNVLREDVVKETITQQEALKNAPDKNSDYFKIPKVLEK